VAIIAAGAFVFYNHFAITGIFLVLLGLFNVTRWQKLKFLRQLPEILRSNMDGLDEVYAGKRWIGKEGIIVANSVPEIYDYGKARVRMVCRTENGAWFVVRAALVMNRTLEFCIEGVGDQAAKSLLLTIDRELCERHFGTFTVA
jgi:hypothetical protein